MFTFDKSQWVGAKVAISKKVIGGNMDIGHRTWNIGIMGIGVCCAMMGMIMTTKGR